MHALAENDSAARGSTTAWPGVDRARGSAGTTWRWRWTRSAARSATSRASWSATRSWSPTTSRACPRDPGAGAPARCAREALDVAPTALTNLGLAYNEGTGTLDQRSNCCENLEIGPRGPGAAAVHAAQRGRAGRALRRADRDLFDDGAPELPLPRAEPFVGDRDRRPAPVEVEQVDPTLGGCGAPRWGRGSGLRAVGVVAALATVLRGCDFSVYDLPLPGGADVGEDAYEVTIQFEDVLDLVPQSSVKVDDVTVGRVTDVDLDGWTPRSRWAQRLGRTARQRGRVAASDQPAGREVRRARAARRTAAPAGSTTVT